MAEVAERPYVAALRKVETARESDSPSRPRLRSKRLPWDRKS